MTKKKIRAKTGGYRDKDKRRTVVFAERGFYGGNGKEVNGIQNNFQIFTFVILYQRRIVN